MGSCHLLIRNRSKTDTVDSLKVKSPFNWVKPTWWLGWVAQLLNIGHYTNVTQGVHRMSQKPGRKLIGLRQMSAASK